MSFLLVLPCALQPQVSGGLFVLLHVVENNLLHYRALICKSLVTIDVKLKMKKKKTKEEEEERRRMISQIILGL